jgi:hypothetical protein
VNRRDLAHFLTELTAGGLTILDARSGWPALGTVEVGDSRVPVAVFVAPIGLSQRGRDDVERRFQNPDSDRPIVVPPDHVPLLLGVWTDDPLVAVLNPVLVLADADRRRGLTTRYSVFVRLEALQTATVQGWAESVSEVGERMILFHPGLLPSIAFATSVGVALPERDAAIAVSASGLLEKAPDPLAFDAAERARRSVLSLVRDARFARDVVRAYAGLCALCGLDLGLVQGAHIYPASAPGSSDEIWNGVCLCSNHHAAFDRHLLWIDPDDRAVIVNPVVVEQAADNSAAATFVQLTSSTLRPPDDPTSAPAADMFVRRYEYFEGRYDWVA